jgi:hypothetical protein
MILNARPGAYIVIILAVVAGTFVYSLRMNGIFACQTAGYGSDRYLAYCQATKYGDYDYGAFWFDLEPEATAAAANAEVLFVGNSRMEFGLSSEAISNWFSSRAISYYLLGFSYDGNYNFEAPLLRRLHPQAKVYVINIDLFFGEYLSPPLMIIRGDPNAKARFEEKRGWQRIHKALCGTFPAVCGDEVAFFRSRVTGDWIVQGGQFESGSVSYDDRVDEDVLKAYTAAGTEFISNLPVDRDCVMLTMVPKRETGNETMRAVAAALGVNLYAPELEGLTLFDGSHLDRESKERWSSAFLEAAGPQIQACLDKS